MKKVKYIVVLLLAVFAGIWTFKKYNINSSHEVGDVLDSLNHVYVYYNGGVDHVSGRNTTKEGYNLGLKYQCVEFVKRYYYEYLNHKMPDSYGNAKDFYSAELGDGQRNKSRGLKQCSNPSSFRPKVNDLLIFDGSVFNRFGHVAIVSEVTEKDIEIIQQNPGPFSNSRERFTLERIENKWYINHGRIVGWLRKEV
ncbi:MAG: CHAP domain-containing protein [Flavobacteriales bacterium]